MSSCCSSSYCNVNSLKKHPCPANGLAYLEVSVKTIVHHLREPWCWTPTGRHYYFCDDPECDVVYFGDDDSVVPKSRLRTRVGAKGRDGNGLLCYCFGVTMADFERNPAIKDFVIAVTSLDVVYE